MSAPRGSAAAKARAYAGILSSESAGVMAMMRQNAKWALAPGYGYGDDDPPGDPLLEEFKSMRRALFTWRDWDRVAPVAYLAPFLHVIRSVAADQADDPLIGLVQTDQHQAVVAVPVAGEPADLHTNGFSDVAGYEVREPLAAGGRWRRLNLRWTRFAVERVGAAVLPDHQAQPNRHQRQGRQEWVADPLGGHRLDPAVEIQT